MPDGHLEKFFKNLKGDYKELKNSFQNQFPNNGNNILAALAILLGSYTIYSNLFDEDKITYTELFNYLQESAVEKIIIERIQEQGYRRHEAIISLKNTKKLRISLGDPDHFISSVEKFQTERGVSVYNLIPIEVKPVSAPNTQLERIRSVFHTLTLLGFVYLGYKGMKMVMKIKGNDVMGLSKSHAKLFGLDDAVKIKFSDVAGMQEAKFEVREFVDFLKNPKKYQRLGARAPRGALLYGPPGTGKTLLAKAVAGEANVPFYSVSGSDFVQMVVGVGSGRVRDLFKNAREKAPSIIFIDEVDAIARKRECIYFIKVAADKGNDERESTLNQILVEMDGFGTDTNVIVIAATNRKDILDPAMTRPGRFDRMIEIGNPDLEGRMEIFSVYLSKVKLDAAHTIEETSRKLAALSPGFTGADISNVVNEAAINAARNNMHSIVHKDFDVAIDRVIGGYEKHGSSFKENKWTVAIHECGHGVVSWFLPGGDPLLKLTIVPRSKGALGFAQYLPNEGYLHTKDELFNKISSILGGRIAEEEFFNKVTTGAYDDLQKVTKISKALVKHLGMTDSILNVAFPDSENGETASNYIMKIMDKERKRIVDECAEITRKIIKEKRPKLEQLAQRLMEKETLHSKDIIEILGERPFPPKDSYKIYLQNN